jgi:hypothetical protein
MKYFRNNTEATVSLVKFLQICTPSAQYVGGSAEMGGKMLTLFWL